MTVFLAGAIAIVAALIAYDLGYDRGFERAQKLALDRIRGEAQPKEIA